MSKEPQPGPSSAKDDICEPDWYVCPFARCTFVTNRKVRFDQHLVKQHRGAVQPKSDAELGSESKRTRKGKAKKRLTGKRKVAKVRRRPPTPQSSISSGERPKDETEYKLSSEHSSDNPIDPVTVTFDEESEMDLEDNEVLNFEIDDDDTDTLFEGLELPPLLFGDDQSKYETCDDLLPLNETELVEGDDLEMYERSNSPVAWLKCSLPTCHFRAIRPVSIRYHEFIYHTPRAQVEWLHCSYCAFKTRLAYNLKQHQVRRHTPSDLVKWFYCKYCQFRCKTRSYLYTHIKTKHFPPDFESCTYTVKVKGGVKFFYCIKCDFNTYVMDAMKRHVTMKHSNIVCRIVKKPKPKPWENVVAAPDPKSPDPTSVDPKSPNPKSADPKSSEPKSPDPQPTLLTIDRPLFFLSDSD